jgi:transcriptional regulator with XRE-family HTH domain
MSSASKSTSPAKAAAATDLSEARLRAEVGVRVRHARERAGLTGRKLAELAEVTPGFVSQIERGQVTPSLMTLVKVVHVLGIKMGDLFDAKRPPLGEVWHEDDWPIFKYPDGSFEDAVLAIEPEGAFEVIWSTLAPGYGGGNYESPSPGTRLMFVFVLKGEIELHLGKERHVLRPRSCVSVPAQVPHMWQNASSEPAEILSVISPAAY